MEKTTLKLTVYFEEPFWYGLFERDDPEGYQICKHIFGVEPRDIEIYNLVLEQCSNLPFGRRTDYNGVKQEKRINPKRMQREVKKQTKEKGIGTKAQQALKKLQEERKEKGRKEKRIRQEQNKEHQFMLKKEKRKEKHKGH